jgi:hypothetical protein
VPVVADLNPKTEDQELIVVTTALLLLVKKALTDFLFLGMVMVI